MPAALRFARSRHVIDSSQDHVGRTWVGPTGKDDRHRDINRSGGAFGLPGLSDFEMPEATGSELLFECRRGVRIAPISGRLAKSVLFDQRTIMLNDLARGFRALRVDRTSR